MRFCWMLGLRGSMISLLEGSDEVLDLGFWVLRGRSLLMWLMPLAVAEASPYPLIDPGSDVRAKIWRRHRTDGVLELNAETYMSLRYLRRYMTKPSAPILSTAALQLSRDKDRQTMKESLFALGKRAYILLKMKKKARAILHSDLTIFLAFHYHGLGICNLYIQLNTSTKRVSDPYQNEHYIEKTTDQANRKQFPACSNSH